MKTLIVSSSNRPGSRSHRLAELARNLLGEQGVEATLVRLADHPLPSFTDAPEAYLCDAYRHLHAITAEADSIILASPVYNWSACAELKKYIEYIGSTPPDGSATAPFFDKVISMLMAGGLPQSYMAGTPLMLGMLLDFKCILNPYMTYTSNDDWDADGSPGEIAGNRLVQTLRVHVELTRKLSGRSYQSSWCV